MRAPDALTLAILAGKRAAEGAARRAGAPWDDIPDIVQDACVALLAGVQRGTVTLPEGADLRPAVAAYLAAVAWYLGCAVVRQRSQERPWEHPGGEPPEPFHDPGPWLDARSELRAMTIPDDVLSLLLAIAQDSDLSAFARGLGMPVGTAHDKVRRFRHVATMDRRRRRR